MNVFYYKLLNTSYYKIRLSENAFRAGITLIKRTSTESSQSIVRVKRDTVIEKCKVLNNENRRDL
jgi:hypothetical protein